MLGLIRLMLPKVLLPATTALGTIHPKGRELGILAGANVVMPNLSPTEVRKDYLLYDNKICTGDESAQCRHCLERRMASVGYQVVTSRGRLTQYLKLNTRTKSFTTSLFYIYSRMCFGTFLIIRSSIMSLNNTPSPSGFISVSLENEMLENPVSSMPLTGQI